MIPSRLFRAPSSATKRLGMRLALLLVRVVPAHIARWLPPAGRSGKLLRRGLSFLIVDANPLLASDGARIDLALLRKSKVARQVALSGSDGIRATEVYQLASRAGWDRAGVAWLRSHNRSGADAASVADEVLEDLAGNDAATRRTAMLTVPVVAEVLTLTQVRDIFAATLPLAVAVTDPYRPKPLSDVAGAAITGLVSRRPDLAADIARSVSLDLAVPMTPEARLLALGLRQRPPDNGEAIVDVLAAATSGSTVLEFAEEASTTVAKKPADADRPSDFRRVRALGAVVRTTGALGAPLAVAAGTVTWVRRCGWSPPTNVLDLHVEAGLVALTLVATVNVFTVTLAAQRLPGPVARVAGRPAPILASYGSAAGMIAFALFPGHDHFWSAATGWARIGLTALFALALLATMSSVVSRTDPGRAAVAYLAATRGPAHRAGARLGRLQARGLTLRDTVHNAVGIALTPQPELVGTRARVFASRQGVLLPKGRRLRRLLASSELADGSIQVKVFGSFGGPVTRGQEIAASYPSRSHVVQRRLTRRIRRAMLVRRAPGINAAATAALALTAMALDLARSGDTGSARVVANVTANYVSDHVASARNARRVALRRAASKARRRAARQPASLRPDIGVAASSGAAHDRDAVPEIPALNATITAVIRALVSQPGTQGDVPSDVVRGLLLWSSPAESTATLAAYLVPSRWAEIECSPAAVVNILMICAVWALENQHSATTTLVRASLEQLAIDAGGPTTERLDAVLDGSAAVTAMSCWLSPEQSSDNYAWYTRLPESTLTSAAAYARLTRIGAAAHLAGTSGVAIRAAQAIATAGAGVLDGVEAFMLSAPIRIREAALSRAGGGYLGASPDDAVNNFFRLAKAAGIS